MKEVRTATEKSKTVGTVSTKTKKPDQGKEQSIEGAAGHQFGPAAGLKIPLAELDDLMAKLEQIDKRLKCSQKDRQVLKKEHRHNKNENLDKYFNSARATEVKLQQMANERETTDKEREKHIRKDMEDKKPV